jgi:hypothetical protein
MMTKEKAKDFLVNKINSLNGIKATELVCNEEVIIELGLDDHDVPTLLDELVQENRIMEVEYVVPAMKWRIKSFYLPIGSEIIDCPGGEKGNTQR